MDLSPGDGDGKSSRKRKQQGDDDTENGSGGALWGAQSFSAAKSAAINKNSKDPGFGDFGRYFSEKQRKLIDQFHEDASTSMLRDVPAGAVAPQLDDKCTESGDSGKASKDLFKGVSIFVDGFTNPTHQELRFIMMSHGGVFQNYFSSQRVTHIICSILPDSKIMNPRLMSRGVPIVKPEWIVDCMTANRLLSCDTYHLERIAYAHPHQRTLPASFLSPAKKITSSPSKVGRRDDQVTAGQNEMVLEQPVEQNPAPLLPASSKWQITEVVEPSEAGNHFSLGGIMQNNEGPEATAVRKQARRGQGHSTLNDPDFVQSYFKYSRLHFIGMWRTRYQSLVSTGTFGKPDEVNRMEDFYLSEASSTGRKPLIIHIDMDCFFVSVVIRNRPGLAGKPVAVCHSESAQGTGEISSANYPARSYGIRAGMFVKDAKACCPALTIVPYDFPAYEQVADKVYSILHRHCSTVQAVSCDEAFLDVSGHPDPSNLASRIREEIFLSTQCTASVGIAENLLMARLATKKAKPNGQCHIEPHQVKEFIAALPLDQLPGVGWNLQEKLHAHGLYTCADLQSLPKERLQKDYGAKTGIMLWSYCQGIDSREVQPAQERKSIGAEVNWGVRFSCMDDAQEFLVTLSNEVASRLHQAALSGRTITLKVKRRKEGAGEPYKFMGCGPCDNFSRSETVGYATNSADLLLRVSRQLFASFHLDVQEVRGVGLQMSRLESTNTGTKKKYNEINSWLAPSKKLRSEKDVISNTTTENVRPKQGEEQEKKLVDNIAVPATSPKAEIRGDERLKQRQHTEVELQVPVVSGGPTLNDVPIQRPAKSDTKRKPRKFSLELPPLSQLDRSVLEFLPEDIVAEINDADRVREEQKLRESAERNSDIKPKIRLPVQRPAGEKLNTKRSKSKLKPRNNLLALPPESQLDLLVLESLPEDIRAEIVSAYEEEHLRKSSRTQASNPHPHPQDVLPEDIINMKGAVSMTLPDIADNPGGSNDSLRQFSEATRELVPTGEAPIQDAIQLRQSKSLQGTEPADFYALLENTILSSQSLPSNLLSLGCYLPVHESRDLTGLEDLVQHCLRLLIQYIQGIAANDLEELQLVLLYTKRLGSRCKFWGAVQDLLLPAVQDIVTEVYGGQLIL